MWPHLHCDGTVHARNKVAPIGHSITLMYMLQDTMHDLLHPKQCLPFRWVSARPFAFFACNGILSSLCCVNCQDLDNGLCNIEARLSPPLLS